MKRSLEMKLRVLLDININDSAEDLRYGDDL